MRRRFLLPALLSGAFALAASSPAGAVTLYRTADPAANTTAPTGVLAGSGWELQGNFYGFQGTPIAPRFFLTAKHLQFPVGTTFAFQGVTYTTVARYPDPGTDLCLWQVDGTFPSWAPLLNRPNPAGEGLVVFGRGTRRGAAVNVNGNLVGWQWGAGDGVLRWGTNTVTGTVNGGPELGQLLYATFDAPATGVGGPEEAHLSGGDSGGGVFVRDGDGVWKLAGINYGVNGPYAYTANGANSFHAAIFAGDGLWEFAGNNTFLPTSGPGAFYATEVFARLNFIRLVLGEVPLARLGGDVLFGFASESGRTYRVEFCDDLLTGNWATVPGAASVAGTGYRVLVTDPGAAGQPRRFYRAVLLP